MVPLVLHCCDVSDQSQITPEDDLRLVDENMQLPLAIAQLVHNLLNVLLGGDIHLHPKRHQ